MSETDGHFDNGRWVPNQIDEPDLSPAPEEEEREEEGAAPDEPSIDERMHEAGQSLRKAVADVVNAGQHLLGTSEGHEHIQQAARKAGEDLEHAINAWTEAARKALQRK